MLPSLCPGGAERILITLMNNLNRERFTPEFLVLNNTTQIKDWIAEDIPFHSLGKGSVRKSILGLHKFIKEHQPDVIFTTMVHINGLALIMKLFFPHIRVVVREAALPSSILTGYGIKGKMCRLIYKYLYPKADLVLSNCSQVLREFKTEIKHKPYNHKILFNPVDKGRIFEAMPEKFEPIKDRKKTVYFICVGRLSFEKGYDRLIRILENFEHDYNWRLDIIGEGDYRTKLEALIESRGLEKNVFLRGYYSYPWKIAAQADCLILPSRWEGMPNVVLEGFACGLPALAMREAGGISDIAKYADTDILQIVDTVDELVEKMKAVQPKVKTKCAPSLLPDEFSLPYIMEQFESILKPHQKRLSAF